MSHKFDESKLRPLDAFCITDMSPAAIAIRARTVSPLAAFDMKWATHSGYVVEIGGKLWLVEMTADGCTPASIDKYIGNGYWGTRYVSMKRHPCWDDPVSRKSANDWLVETAHDDDIKYNVMGILKFLSPDDERFNPNNSWKAEYCSELVNRVAYRFGCGALYSEKDACPPVDVQRSSFPEVTGYLV